jgi:hypothetical protein
VTLNNCSARASGTEKNPSQVAAISTRFMRKLLELTRRRSALDAARDRAVHHHPARSVNFPGGSSQSKLNAGREAGEFGRILTACGIFPFSAEFTAVFETV